MGGILRKVGGGEGGCGPNPVGHFLHDSGQLKTHCTSEEDTCVLECQKGWLEP